MPKFAHRPDYWLAAALAVAAIFRAYTLAAFGPILQPDSADYLTYAKVMLAGYGWIHSASVEDVTSFRMIGYPALIAMSQLAAGPYFGFLLVAVQSTLTLVTMAFLYRVGRGLGLTGWLAACAVLAYSFGVAAVFDLNILTDSLFSNLAVVTICILALAILNRAPVTFAAASGLGALFAVCILVREVAFFAFPFFALGVFAWGYDGDRSWRRGLRAVALFLVPALIVWQGYLAWNQYRTGYRFMTTGGQHAYLMKPVMIEDRGSAVLDDARLRKAYVATKPLAGGEFFTRVREMNVHLYSDAKLNAVERTRLNAGTYATAWLRAPMAMLTLVAQEYRANQFLLLINFNFALREIKGLAGVENNPGYRAYFVDLLAKPGSKTLAVLVLELIGLGFSGLVFLGFIYGGAYGLWAVVCRGDRKPSSFVAAWLLLFYAGFVGMYALIHLELRYAICMQAIVLIAGTAALWNAIVSARSYFGRTA